jgi:RNA polymerase sigma factor (sigma-70 family)
MNDENGNCPPPLSEQKYIDPALLAKAQAFLRLGKEQRARDVALETAWEQFFEIEGNHLRRLFCERSLNHDMRQEVTQKVWVELVAHLHRFHGDHSVASLYAWLRKVVDSKAVDAIRHLARERTVMIDNDTVELADTRYVEESTTHEIRDWLAVKLAEMPATFTLIAGHFLDGRAIVDLAAEAGITAEAARCRIHRGMALLRQCGSDLIGNS